MTQFKSILFIITLLIVFKVDAKDFDGKSFICADEVGPLLEFPIPKFDNNLKKQKILLKLYNKENRNIQFLRNGIIKKKTSAIDKSYFFYTVNFIYNDTKSEQGYFEFYPPSNLMFKIKGSHFLNLVCWI
tara:strand:+ start:640 stop:1029 length:390 start_codon:yes stop_codon:yes gene_type:complete